MKIKKVEQKEMIDEKVRRLTLEISKNREDINTALEDVLQSKTYSLLTNPKTGFLFKSDEAILDLFLHEEKGEFDIFIDKI